MSDKVLYDFLFLQLNFALHAPCPAYWPSFISPLCSVPSAIGLSPCYFLWLECAFLFFWSSLPNVRFTQRFWSFRSSYTMSDSLLIGTDSRQDVCFMIFITVLTYIYWDYFINAWLYSWNLNSTRLRCVYFCSLFSLSAHKVLKVFAEWINCAVPNLILFVLSRELILNLENMEQI